MNRCLSERAMLRVYLEEGTAAERSHLRLCAACAQSYDAFVDDLQVIGDVLANTPPPPRAASRAPGVHFGWVPATVMAALLAVVASVVLLHRSAPEQIAARSPNVSAFAADVSAALFASPGAGDILPADFETSYLDAALEAGVACTQERYFNGECADQLSALFLESE